MNYIDGLLSSLTRVKDARSLRASSWDTTGRNNDAWDIPPGETRVLADIKGTGCINHIWMTQPNGYRNVLIQMFWMMKNIRVFCVRWVIFSGLETKSLTLTIPFHFQPLRIATINLIRGARSTVICKCHLTVLPELNLSTKVRHRIGNTFMLIMNYPVEHGENLAYFHAQFHRQNPCDGWEHEIKVNTAEANIINAERLA